MNEEMIGQVFQASQSGELIRLLQVTAIIT